MKTSYTKTTWVDNRTPINAERLNNIENGISSLYQDALSISDLVQGSGIKLSATEEGLKISLNLRQVLDTSVGRVGDYYIEPNNEYLYFCISENPVRWIKLKLYEL